MVAERGRPGSAEHTRLRGAQAARRTGPRTTTWPPSFCAGSPRST
ncbi:MULTISPECIES: hypothetical protein [Streptomyces]|nr:hypothetical protein [Streptomyces sp. NRRL S-237]